MFNILLLRCQTEHGLLKKRFQFGGDSQGYGNDPRTLGLYATGNSGDMYEDDDDLLLGNTK